MKEIGWNKEKCLLLGYQVASIRMFGDLIYDAYNRVDVCSEQGIHEGFGLKSFWKFKSENQPLSLLCASILEAQSKQIKIHVWSVEWIFARATHVVPLFSFR